MNAAMVISDRGLSHTCKVTEVAADGLTDKKTDLVNP